MIKFIELSGIYEFKWEFKKTETSNFGSSWKTTKYNTCTLKGEQLIDWMQTYGITPDKMFADVEVGSVGSDSRSRKVEYYDLKKKADEWAKENQETINNNPWTCVGMNGGYVLLSDGKKENLVELGSAPAPANVNINNSNRNNIHSESSATVIKNSIF